MAGSALLRQQRALQDPSDLQDLRALQDLQALRDLRERVAPVTLAAEQGRAVPEALRPLFPAGGLARGISVGFQGQGAWSVALALAAAALGTDGWLALLGLEELGLAAAAELGVRLDRVLLVTPVGAAELGRVAATLMEAMDVVALAPRSPVALRDARRLTARARERGTVLFHLDGGRHWPEPLDLVVTAATGAWSGLGHGHGHLQGRRIDLTAAGRRAASQPRRASVLLAPAEPDSAGPGAADPTGHLPGRPGGVEPVGAGPVLVLSPAPPEEEPELGQETPSERRPLRLVRPRAGAGAGIDTGAGAGG